MLRERQRLSQRMVVLPERRSLSDVIGPSCKYSERHLAFCSPHLLKEFVPIHVEGDGNCLFRSISFGLYGKQSAHIILRVLAALEMMANPDYYDSSSNICHAILRREDIQSPPISDCFREVTSYGTSCCMPVIIALSSVTGVMIDYFIPPTDPSFPAPFNLQIEGRKPCNGTVRILWTVMSDKPLNQSLSFNHYVPLVPRNSTDDGDSDNDTRGL